MTEGIVLVRLPEIKHQLKIVGAEVKKRIDDLNIDNLVATEETIKSLKELRTDLNKEFSELEIQRKDIKTKINAPYIEMEDVYKTEIKGRYEPAILLLGEKISFVEAKLKEERKKTLLLYFEELKSSYGEKLSFLIFPQINITLSESIKKQKTVIQEYIENVVSDLSLIETESEQLQAKIVAEYKSNGFNCSKAIIDVKKREDDAKREEERILNQRTQRRTTTLQNMAFVYHDLTKTFNCINDENIMVTFSEIEIYTDELWSKKIDELKIKIEAKKEVLQAPIVEDQKLTPEHKKESVKIFTATFEVSGTYDQLTELNNYLKQNKLTYKNL